VGPLWRGQEVDCPIAQEWAGGDPAIAPDADGLRWMAKRDNVHFAAMLFDDHDPGSRIRGEIIRRFSEPADLAYAVNVLAGLNVKVT